MAKSCVHFEVRTEFLNIIWTSFGFKRFLELYLNNERQNARCFIFIIKYIKDILTCFNAPVTKSIK
jgi:hypothetical protein